MGPARPNRRADGRGVINPSAGTRDNRGWPAWRRSCCDPACSGHKHVGIGCRDETKPGHPGSEGPFRYCISAAAGGGLIMLLRLMGGRVIDPANGRDGIGDVWIRDDRVVEAPSGSLRADTSYDVTGKIVMAGAIDIHSHIAGVSVNTARLLMPEHHGASQRRPDATPLANAGWTTAATGRLYAAMGFTTVIEPAVAPHY